MLGEITTSRTQKIDPLEHSGVVALPQSGWQTFRKLTCWVRGTNPSTLERKGARARQNGCTQVACDRARKCLTHSGVVDLREESLLSVQTLRGGVAATFLPRTLWHDFSQQSPTTRRNDARVFEGVHHARVCEGEIKTSRTKTIDPLAHSGAVDLREVSLLSVKRGGWLGRTQPRFISLKCPVGSYALR
jgi:hypothetical protein